MSTPARAAIAGNPSDGFGGAVCALVVPDMSVTARVVEGDADAAQPLVQASIRRFHTDVAPVPLDRTVRFETTIPRSVGLAGSSAIVIETLRSLCVAAKIELEPMALAQLAHSVERVDLAIAGGWQDQLIQAHGFSAVMDFADVASIDKLDFTTERAIPIYLAWNPSAAQSSSVVHTELATRGRPHQSVVDEFATAAHTAAAAFKSGDVHGLKSAIDQSFELRSSIMTLEPAQRRMVDRARQLGACANYAGSGGAIVGVVPKEAQVFLDAMMQWGYEMMTWDAH